MSINLPSKREGDKPAERGRVKIWWLLAILLVVASFVILYRTTNLFAPSYRAVGIYHPPTYRPLPEQGGKPEGVMPAEIQRSGQKMPDKANPPPQPQQPLTQTLLPPPPAQPLPAPTVKPEEKPVQKEPVKPPPAPAAPAKPQVKAVTPPAATVTASVAEPAEPAKAAKKVVDPAGAYTLLVGEYAGGQDMKKLRAMLKKVGITPVRETKATRLDVMHRLHLGDFDSYQAADAALHKLRQQDVDGFVLKGNGKYAVYAGSFLQEKRAVAEQQRLAGKEIKLSIQTAQVTVSLTRVTAGSFSSGEAAQKKADYLEKQGVNAKVVKGGS
jgi:cell division protein FtsN